MIAKGRQPEGPHRYSVPRHYPVIKTSYFARNEREPAGKASELHEAMKACAKIEEEKFFEVRDRRLARVLAPAYLLARLIELGGDEAYETVAAHPHFKAQRERAPQAGKPALLAVLFTLQPSTEDRRKLCSSWAYLLIRAAQLRIKLKDFEGWASKVSLSDCKEEVRATKKKLARESEAEPEAVKRERHTNRQSKADVDKDDILAGETDRNAETPEDDASGNEEPAEKDDTLKIVSSPDLMKEALRVRPGGRVVLVGTCLRGTAKFVPIRNDHTRAIRTTATPEDLAKVLVELAWVLQPNAGNALVTALRKLADTLEAKQPDEA